MINLLKNFILFSSGARKEVLEACRRKGYDEVNKFLTVGITVVLTGVFAAIAGGYAIYRVFVNYEDGIWYSVMFACLLGLMIYNLDRFIVQGIDKTSPWWRQGLISIPRILLAVLISIVISKPLEVKLFSDRLAYEIQETKIKTDSLNTLQITGNYGVNDKLTAFEQADSKYQDAKDRASSLPDTPEYKEAKKNYDHCDRRLSSLESKNFSRIAKIKEEISLVKKDPGNFMILDGVKDFYIGAQERLNRLSSEKARLNSQVTSKRRECNRINDDIEKLEKEYRGLWSGRVSEYEKERLAKQESFNEANNDASQEVENTKKITSRSFNDNFISQLEALGRLTEGDETFRLINLFVILLFIMVETAPVFIKLFQTVDIYDEELILIKKKYRYKSEIEFEAFKRDENEVFKIESEANEGIIAKLADVQMEVAEAVIDEWKKEEISKVGL